MPTDTNNNLSLDFNSLSSLDKKFYLEDAIKDILDEIETANRPPTKWEVDHIKIALDYILAGMYIAAGQAISFCRISPEELANPEPFFTPDIKTSIRDLSDGLYYVKGVPPRKI